MIVVDIEVIESEMYRLAEFIDTTANSIAEGYGAGNCTPESCAFWSLYAKQQEPGWSLLHIELYGDSLDELEIAGAVKKVTIEPEGNIDMFGNIVGRWVLSPA